jgi:galactose mutarotase-like enzyme
MPAAIAHEQRQYATYLLSQSEPDSLLEVVPERGGIALRWQFQGKEIFYLDAERFKDPTLSVRGGNPILFPICGNLPDNTYTHNGQSYQLKQHGFARELPWQVSPLTDEASGKLVLSLESNDQTRAVYPFEFYLAFSYQLVGNQLLTTQTVTNPSTEALPFSLGFHPYFLVDDKSQLRFDIPACELIDQKTKIAHAFAGEFDLSQDELDLIFPTLTRSSAHVVDLQQGIRLTLDFSDAYRNLVFWTVKGKPFYCLEPWTAGRNAMNTGDRLIALEPGASFTAFVNFTIEPW